MTWNGPQTTIYNDGPHTTIYNDGPPTTIYNDGPPTTIHNDGPPTTIYNDGPHTTIYNDGPPTTIYIDEPQTTIYNDGPPSTIHNNILLTGSFWFYFTFKGRVIPPNMSHLFTLPTTDLRRSLFDGLYPTAEKEGPISKELGLGRTFRVVCTHQLRNEALFVNHEDSMQIESSTTFGYITSWLTSIVLCLFANSGVQHILRCALFVFLLCILCFQFLWIVHC